MTSSSSIIPDHLLEIASNSSTDELAWHIRDSGLMHNPDCAALVERARRGQGENSLLLSASVPDPDEPVSEPQGDGKPTAAPKANPAMERLFYGESAGRRQRVGANPFALPKAVERLISSRELPPFRSAVLTDEVAEVYRCLAFAMWAYGAVMNGHMTVAWEAFGVREHERAVRILTELNARMRKWLAADAKGRRRKGVTSLAWGPGEDYFYAYIHEHVPGRGFHTHQLFHVSDGKAKAFAEYAQLALRRLTGVSTVPANGVRFTPGTARDGFAPHLHRFKANEVERNWIWFKYLAKNLSPHVFKQVGDECLSQRDIFRIRRVFMEPLPVRCSQLFGCSENIGVGVQRAVNFVSRFDSGDWSDLYRGRELSEYQAYLDELRTQKVMGEVLDQMTI